MYERKKASLPETLYLLYMHKAIVHLACTYIISAAAKEYVYKDYTLQLHSSNCRYSDFLLRWNCVIASKKYVSIVYIEKHN